jgi:hypothetical protein
MTDANVNKFSNSINLSTILTDNTLSNINQSSRTTAGDGESICNSTVVTAVSVVAKKTNEPSSLNQIDSDKVDAHLLGILNHDFVELGFQPILSKHTREVNYSQIVKNAADVLLRLKRSSGQIEKAQDQLDFYC